MALPLPYVVRDDDVQGNFDELKKQWPLSRQHMAIETPHRVGAAGEPAFQNGWANFDPSEVTWRGARFWKDPMGLVHIEGLIAGGGGGTAAFRLPTGYLPGSGLIFTSDMNNIIHARIDLAPTGDVVVRFGTSGTNTYVSLSGISFKQEN